MGLKITVGMIIGYHFNIVFKLSKKPIDSDIERLYDLISHNKTWNQHITDNTFLYFEPNQILNLSLSSTSNEYSYSWPWINLVVTLLNHDTTLLKIETNTKTLKF